MTGYRFAVVLEQSIRRMAAAIKKEVKETNNMQEWSFEWYRPDAVFRAIDFQFADASIDFVPAVLELQSALNDHRPERFAKVKLNVSNSVDSWLKKQSSRNK